MANNIEKELLEELKRFNQIKHNSENLTEQHTPTMMGIGGVANLGMGSHVERLLNRAKAMEMAEQEEEEVVDDADDMSALEDIEVTPADDTEAEEIDTGDEDMAMDTDMDAEMDTDVIEDGSRYAEDVSTEDSTELDVTDLVTKQDEVNTELSDQKDILSKNTQSLDDLMTKLDDLETHLSSMDDMVNKIVKLEDKLEEYRPRTPEEKIGLRKHDSGPYNKTLSDFFTDKEEVFDKTGKKQYILTKDEVENYSDIDIQKSFADPDERKRRFYFLKFDIPQLY